MKDRKNGIFQNVGIKKRLGLVIKVSPYFAVVIDSGLEISLVDL